MRAILALASSLFAASLLSGCSTSFSTAALNTSSTGAAITGIAHGGRQPIVGAKVYLLEANTTAWAGPGIAADDSNSASNNASRSLLNRGDGTDSIGAYVLTDTSGFFSITGDYTCDTNGQVYLLALGGMPDGVNTNSSAGLMAVLGPCGSFGSSTTIVLNEVSTIAAGYAFAGFATDATHVGAPSSTDALAATGIANAFANAQQIFDATSASPYLPNVGAPTSTKYGSGVVPQQQVNTLANILSACINTTVGGTPCPMLFSGLMSNGATGSEATDTATEAIYMAHNPTVAGIYTVAGSGPQPYTPWYNTTAVSDLGIILTFPNILTGDGECASIDSAGNVWTNNVGVLYKFSSLGVNAPGSPFSGTGAYNDGCPTVDSHDNAWITSSSGDSLIEISGSTVNTIPATGAEFGAALAIGSNDNLWLLDNEGSYNVEEYSPAGSQLQSFSISSAGAYMALHPSGDITVDTYNGVYEFDSSGNLTATQPNAGVTLTHVWWLALDHAGNTWIADGDKGVAKIDANNQPDPLSPWNSGDYPAGVAIDGAGNAWVAGYDFYGFYDITANGANQPPVYGGFEYGTYGPGIAVDGSGNVWATIYCDTSVYCPAELVGAAVPVVTPLSAGVVNNTLGTRP